MISSLWYYKQRTALSKHWQENKSAKHGSTQKYKTKIKFIYFMSWLLSYNLHWHQSNRSECTHMNFTWKGFYFSVDTINCNEFQQMKLTSEKFDGHWIQLNYIYILLTEYSDDMCHDWYFYYEKISFTVLGVTWGKA